MMATYTGFSNKYNSSYSSIYNDRDSAIQGYESRIKQLYEIVNKSQLKAVDLKALIEVLTKSNDVLIEENKELKIELDKIHSRFDILDL
jgi:predicted component of type VI protein secretion system